MKRFKQNTILTLGEKQCIIDFTISVEFPETQLRNEASIMANVSLTLDEIKEIFDKCGIEEAQQTEGSAEPKSMTFY